MVVYFIISSGVEEKSVLFAKQNWKAVRVIGGNYYTAVKKYFIAIGKGVQRRIGQFVNRQNGLKKTLLKGLGHANGLIGKKKMNLLGMGLKGSYGNQTDFWCIKMAAEITEGVVMITKQQFLKIAIHFIA